MRLLYVLHQTPATDGSSKAFMALLKEVMGKGIEPYVVLPDRRGLYPILAIMGIPTLICTYRNNIFPHCRTIKETFLFLPRLTAKLLCNRVAVWRITHYAKANAIDLIHTNVSVVNVGFCAAQRLGIPHVYHIREYADLIGMRYFPHKASFIRQLTAPLSYTICITKDIRRHYGLERYGNAAVIYDGLCHPLPAYPQTPREGYLLYVGRIETIKGLEHLLHAYALYLANTTRTKALPLYVAGKVSDEAFAKDMERYVSKHDMERKVMFLGHRDDIENLMEKATALVVPSLMEGFGFCMPEAMFHGCLVIAYNQKGTKEQLDNGLQLTGQDIALRYEKTEELTKLLTFVTENPSGSFDDYRQRAFRVVNTLYTIEENARQVVQFYKLAMNRQ